MRKALKTKVGHLGADDYTKRKTRLDNTGLGMTDNERQLEINRQERNKDRRQNPEQDTQENQPSK